MFISTPSRFLKHISMALGLAITTSSYAAGPDEQMIVNMLEAEYKNGGFKQGADCLGISEKKLLDALKANTLRCFQSGSMDDDCMEEGFQASLGVSESKFEHCEQLAEAEEGSNGFESEADALMEQLDDIYDELDGREPSAQQQAQIAMLEDRLKQSFTEQREHSLEEMSDAVELMAKSSAGTEGSITLPLYPKASMMIHMVAGVEMGGVQSLPAATFASADTQERIIAFYKKKLPNFEYKDLGGAGYLFMKEMPENFNMMSNLEDFMTTPHVFISSAKAGGGAPAGTQSMIEVAYKK
ncbi:hypothetical protein [Agaribacterium sp. ZY112]|uniref:hypothetical protein n=1 Tax=Agaribacterium sp. ZY112 TaxID=3233574 RepID=UPI0035265B37